MMPDKKYHLHSNVIYHTRISSRYNSAVTDASYASYLHLQINVIDSAVMQHALHVASSAASSKFYLSIVFIAA